MFWSRYYLPTLKDAPADAEVVSHKLMTRAGMIRKLTSGIYNYLPYGVKAIEKVSSIVREEMNRAGALEVHFPMVIPGDLWKESGRWEKYGKELLRFKDRNERDYCLGPTHEEVVTDLVRGEVRSYKQLPLNLYQIQTKFRDEIRPRFGLMRGREFLMKDGYSFDKDDAGAEASYQAMFDAYVRIFTRLGLRFKAVEADSGAIGGNFSHEFMVLAKTGEDTVVACKNCTYGANLERAEVQPSGKKPQDAIQALEEVPTPGSSTIADLAALLKVGEDALMKTMLYMADGKKVAVLVRGDRSVNEVKVKNKIGAADIEPMTEAEAKAAGAVIGFAGPLGLHVDALLADFEIADRNAWIAGINKKGVHVRNCNPQRDFPQAVYGDFRDICETDTCPRCGGTLEFPRGIEVGHVFKLGCKYSEAMHAVFLDENGVEHNMIMGCYGIGVTRVIAASIEQNYDEDGIMFPPAIAPFEVALLNLDVKSPVVCEAINAVLAAVEQSGSETLVDDRDERPGVKFKDADLIGAPMQLVLGSKSLERGVVEAKDRRTGEKTELPIDGFETAFAAWKATVCKGWNERR